METTGNMLIVQVIPVNGHKPADRLCVNEMVVTGNKVGVVENAEFANDTKDVTVTIRETDPDGAGISFTTTVPRKYEFNTVGMVTK